jgi:hypothetical protein
MKNTTHNANYMIKCTELNRTTWTAYERTLRKAIRHSRFIERFGTARSICTLSLKVPGKVMFYRVNGHPEKSEGPRRAKDIK